MSSPMQGLSHTAIMRDVIGEIFQSTSKNSILQHANDLMVKSERSLENKVSLQYMLFDGLYRD
jgi:hypothetical protein